MTDVLLDNHVEDNHPAADDRIDVALANEVGSRAGLVVDMETIDEKELGVVVGAVLADVVKEPHEHHEQMGMAYGQGRNAVTPAFLYPSPQNRFSIFGICGVR